jgi:hypothetical protein
MIGSILALALFLAFWLLGSGGAQEALRSAGGFLFVWTLVMSGILGLMLLAAVSGASAVAGRIPLAAAQGGRLQAGVQQGGLKLLLSSASLTWFGSVLLLLLGSWLLWGLQPDAGISQTGATVGGVALVLFGVLLTRLSRRLWQSGVSVNAGGMDLTVRARTAHVPGPAPAAPAPALPGASAAIPNRPLSGTLGRQPFRPNSFKIRETGYIELSEIVDGQVRRELGVTFFKNGTPTLPGLRLDWDGPAERHSGADMKPSPTATWLDAAGEKQRESSASWDTIMQLEIDAGPTQAARCRIRLRSANGLIDVAGHFDTRLEEPELAPCEDEGPYVWGSIECDRPAEKVLVKVGISGKDNSRQFQKHWQSSFWTPGSRDYRHSEMAPDGLASACGMDVDGAPVYRHLRVPPGTYKVYAKVGQQFGWCRVEVEEGSTIRANLRVETRPVGRLEVRVEGDGHGSTVEALPADDSGERCIAGDLYFRADIKDGCAVLDDLPAGKYRVSTITAVGEWIEVKPGETARTELVYHYPD